MMRSRRVLLGVLALIGTLALGALLLDESAGLPNESVVRDPLPAASRAPAPERSDPLLRSAIRGPCRVSIIDLLTRQPVRLPEAVVLRGRDRFPAAFESFNLPDSGLEDPLGELILEFRASSFPSARVLRRQFRPEAIAESESYQAQVPYRSALRIAIRSHSTLEALAGAARVGLVDEAAWDAVLNDYEIPGATVFARSSLQQRIQRYERLASPIDWVSVHPQADRTADAILPGSGRVICSVSSPGFRPYLFESATVNGGVREEEVFLHRRPTIEGRIFNADGTPASGATVVVKVMLDDAEFDLFQEDLDTSAGMIGGGPLNQETRIAILQFTASDEGVFHGPILFGSRLAVWAELGADYRFLELSSVPREGVVSAGDLFLGETSGSPDRLAVRLRLLQKDGVPLGHATVRVSIVNDEPWFRVFPAQITDETGLVALHDFPLGTNLAIIIESGDSTGARTLLLKLDAHDITLTL